LATSYQRTEQHQLAVEYFIAALRINPQQPRLWISLGISQQNLSQREQALSSYKMALRSGSVNQRLHDFVQSKIKQLSN
jgi:Tfp pilus assembly protein PilF